MNRKKMSDIIKKIDSLAFEKSKIYDVIKNPINISLNKKIKILKKISDLLEADIFLSKELSEFFLTLEPEIRKDILNGTMRDSGIDEKTIEDIRDKIVPQYLSSLMKELEMVKTILNNAEVSEEQINELLKTMPDIYLKGLGLEIYNTEKVIKKEGKIIKKFKLSSMIRRIPSIALLAAAIFIYSGAKSYATTPDNFLKQQITTEFVNKNSLQNSSNVKNINNSSDTIKNLIKEVKKEYENKKNIEQENNAGLRLGTKTYVAKNTYQVRLLKSISNVIFYANEQLTEEKITQKDYNNVINQLQHYLNIFN